MLEEDFVFPVYIHEEVLENIKKLCTKSKLEIFGYLIGSIFLWNEIIYIIIEDFIFLQDAVHSDKYSTAQIEGTAGAYQKEFERIKNMKGNENLRIIGWWHSHPNFGCFLSSTDLLTQKSFFHKLYQVALVLDPVRNELEFFTIDNNKKNGYKSISYAILANN
ncbi:MAG: Mov34/MPN/PAD-1 family protein [Promethearchaeota archaeon]